MGGTGGGNWWGELVGGTGGGNWWGNLSNLYYIIFTLVTLFIYIYIFYCI